MYKQTYDTRSSFDRAIVNTSFPTDLSKSAEEVGIIQVGLDFRTSSLEMLQHCNLSFEEVLEYLQPFQRHGIMEVALLKTCNRFEVYIVADAPDDATATLLWFINERLSQMDCDRTQLMVRRGGDVVQHLISVTAGLESALVGEYDVVAQVRRAHEAAQKAGTVGTILSRLFQHAMQYNKRIRNTLGTNKAKRSVTEIGVQWLQSKCATKTKPVALIVGGGETARQTAHHIHALGVESLFVLNRNVQKAIEIAQEFDGQGIELEELPNLLTKADFIAFATSSPIPLLCKEDLETVSVRRNQHPLAIVDFGMPRNVDVSVSECSWIHLLDMFSIVNLAISESGHRENWKQQISDLLEQAAQEFLSWQSEHAIAAMLSDLRSHFEETITSEMLSIQTYPDTHDDLHHFVARLCKKLLHSPIVGLKEIAVKESPDRAEELGKLLFLREHAKVLASGGTYESGK